MKYIAPHGWFLLAFSISSLALGPVVKHAIDLKYAHDMTQGSRDAKLSSPRGQGVTRTLSVYSDYYRGRTTRYGEKYTGEGLTVASNEWKYNTRLRITYKGRSLVVRVTDTMAKKYTGKRVDASHRVWRELTNAKPGLVTVVVEVVK